MQPGDVHLNMSSPGWAKHAWSNVFAPWIAGATVLVLQLRSGSTAAALMARAGPCTGDDVLRAAHGMADAHPGRPGRAADSACGSASPPASRSTRR